MADNKENIIFTPKVEEEGRIDEIPTLTPEDLQAPKLATLPVDPTALEQEEKIMEGVEDMSPEELEKMKAELQNLKEKLDADDLATLKFAVDFGDYFGPFDQRLADLSLRSLPQRQHAVEFDRFLTLGQISDVNVNLVAGGYFVLMSTVFKDRVHVLRSQLGWLIHSSRALRRRG